MNNANDDWQDALGSFDHDEPDDDDGDDNEDNDDDDDDDDNGDNDEEEEESSESDASNSESDDPDPEPDARDQDLEEEEMEEEEEPASESVAELFRDDINDGANGDDGDDGDDGEVPPQGAGLPLPRDLEKYFERKMNNRLRKLINTTTLEHMRKISAYCTWLLKKLLSTDPNEHRLPSRSECQQLRQCYDHWLELWVTNGTWVNELRFIRLPPTPDTPEDQLDHEGRRKVRSALGESVFPELCRMWFLFHYGELKQQKEHLRRNQINVNELEPKDVPSVHWALQHTRQEFWFDEWPNLWPKADNEAFAREKAKDKHATRPRRASPLWERPVMLYTQYEIYQAVMLLTERIDDYPCSHEIIRFIMLLFLRLSTLFCEAAPDTIFDKDDMRVQVHPQYNLFVPNRRFIMWANVYFYELHRRVFWYRLMSSKPLSRTQVGSPLTLLDPLLVRRVRAWVHDSLERIGEEEFEDLYARASEENYAFPGDDQFIRYGHPEGAVSRGDTLMELRPQRQGYRFFSEDAVSHAVILANSKRAETKLDRLMVIMAIDNYFMTKVCVFKCILCALRAF